MINLRYIKRTFFMLLFYFLILQHIVLKN